MARTTNSPTTTGSSLSREAQVGAWRLELLPLSPYCVSFTTEVDTIGFAYDPQTGEHAIASDRRQTFVARSETLAWLPTGCDVFSTSDHGGEYLKITGLNGIKGERCLNNVHDQIASRTARAIRAALLTGADNFDLEPLVLTIVDRMIHALHEPQIPVRGWMTPYRLKRIQQIIDARLEQSILVSDLANEFGLSPGHFTRAFRNATGRSPRDHIIARRLARARELIGSTFNPLSSIAADCGFSSHAHMSALFRRRLGISPSELRHD